MIPPQEASHISLETFAILRAPTAMSPVSFFLFVMTWLSMMFPYGHAFIFTAAHPPNDPNGPRIPGGCTDQQQRTIRAAGNEVLDRVLVRGYNRLRNFDNESSDLQRFFGMLFDEEDPDSGHLQYVTDIFRQMHLSSAFFHNLRIYCNDDHLEPYKDENDVWQQYDRNLDCSTGEKHPMKSFRDPIQGGESTGLTDCQHSAYWARVPKAQRSNERIVDAYTYGITRNGVDYFATVICPSTLMFDLPDDYKTMDAATYDDVIRGIDLDGKLIDDINILSTVMLHEFTHYRPAMGQDRETGDEGYGFTGSVSLRNRDADGALHNADSFAYLGMMMMLEEYQWVADDYGVEWEDRVRRIARLRAKVKAAKVKAAEAKAAKAKAES